MKKYDVFCIGHALMDIVVEVDEGLLASFNLKKGTAHHIDGNVLKAVLQSMRNREKSIAPAGSAANTAMGVAAMGGSAVFNGKVGNDTNGLTYRSIMSGTGVLPVLATGEGMTGSCISMVTPDSERTLAAFSGAGSTIVKEDIDVEKLYRSATLHIEGYQWNKPNQQRAILYAIDIARQHGVRVSFDLSDPLLVERNQDVFTGLLRNKVDIVFANEQEAAALTGKAGPEDALTELGDLCETAVVKLGEKGSLIAANNRLIPIKAYKTNPVDTTGAGDLYAAGFLYGLSKGLSIEKCGNLGSFVASKIVSQYGAMPPENLKKDAEEFLNKLYK